nr:glycosyltransferase family 4 protein [uncultured Allomuricauda sp.]
MKKVLFIGYVWPEPSTTAAGHRMLQLLNAFKNFGYQVVFSSTAAKSEYSYNLDLIDVESVTIKLNHSSFDVFVQELNPDIVVFDRYMMEEQFGWRVAEFAPQALRVLNTEDLHSLRKVREECYKQGEEFTLKKWKNHSMTLREMASIYRSDLSLLISTYEMEILQSELGISKDMLLHLPFMLDEISNKEVNTWPSFEERKDFLCAGNGKHAPNVDSIVTLKRHIWPLIKNRLPEANLNIYGAYLPQQVLEMHNPKEGFYVMGWAEDLASKLKSTRVVLAPLHFGAGIKGKLIDAMKNGTPSVTTRIGAEGMHGNSPWSGVICDDWEVFAKASVQLYENKEKWKQAQSNAVAIINEYYSKTIRIKKLEEKLKHTQSNLTEYREQNFLGRLLQQQTMASTKYMAKWIEEKNRGQA